MSWKHAVLAVLALSTTGCALRGGSGKESDMLQYSTGDRPRPLPFSDAVRAGNLLFVSGQLGVDKDMKLVPGGIQAETRAVMDHIKRIVEANGSSMDRVVKCTCMLADMSEWQKMNEVYVTFFAKDRMPARSAFEAGALALGGRVEIECIAAID
jgi:reactive intermediate/imine deaminase